MTGMRADPAQNCLLFVSLRSHFAVLTKPVSFFEKVSSQIQRAIVVVIFLLNCPRARLAETD